MNRTNQKQKVVQDNEKLYKQFGNDKRFKMELEFLCCLVRLDYIEDLYKKGYFYQPSFRRFLKYMLYWTRPEYARYVIFPQSLHNLKLLQDDSFINLLGSHERCNNLEYYHCNLWQQGRKAYPEFIHHLPTESMEVDSGPKEGESGCSNSSTPEAKPQR